MTTTAAPPPNTPASPPGTPPAIHPAIARYGIDRWGQGYFRVNEQGHITVHPTANPDAAIDLKLLIDDLQRRNLGLPLLVRFDGILKHRLDQLHHAFDHAIRECDYRGKYRFVYPIKVNQQRHVVEQVLRFGKPYGFGVEAGSKPELLALLAMVEDEDTPIICNGFKDAEFIEAVLLAKKMGRRIIPVVEGFSELELIAKFSARHNVRPDIGLRVKLASRGSGRWEDSGGYGSKFGLTVSRVMEALRYLNEQGMADCLKLLHFHLGSQISDIQHVKRGIVEASRVYVEMKRTGASLEYLDVGGGLGVDYGDHDANYTLQEYANDVVYYIREVCEQAGVEHPTIISESGRAVTAYHSVLIFNVLGVAERTPEEGTTELMPARSAGPVKRLFDTRRDLRPSNLLESVRDAQLAWDEVLSAFNLGFCNLDQRAAAERLFFSICGKALELASVMPEPPEEIMALQPSLASTYFVNLSIFQSLPDSWAIDQLFPVVPIHRLNETPTRQGMLADITCDSDGKLDRFLVNGDMHRTLALHPLNGGDYLLAAFLVGAYQEILGDLHNLFGDTNAVHVSLDESGELEIEEIVEGDSVREVLEYVQFKADDLKRAMRKSIEKAVRDKRLTLEESTQLREFYERGLEGYTYLE